MRVLIAPDKFKGSLTALEACEAAARGVRDAVPGTEVSLVPMADGGEGSLDAILARGGEYVLPRNAGVGVAQPLRPLPAPRGGEKVAHLLGADFVHRRIDMTAAPCRPPVL